MRGDETPDGADRAGADRRRHPRRELPFGRSAVLEIDGQNHVVAVADISIGGARLATRTEMSAQSTLRLRLYLPAGGQVVLPCTLVRMVPRPDGQNGHLGGVAVRFLPLDAIVEHHLQRFVDECRSPKASGQSWGDSGA